MFGNAPLGSHYPRSLPLFAKSKTHLPSFQPLAHSFLKTPGCTRIVLYPEGFLRGAILSLARPRRPQTIRHLKILPIPTTVCPHKPVRLPAQFAVLAVHFRSEGLGMTPAASQSAVRVERWRWLLYVGLAFFGALLTFVGARAQQQASDQAAFRKLTDDYCAAWSTGNPDKPAKFYSQDAGRVFYDLAPFSYHNWKEYREGVQKNFFDNVSAASLTAGKDLKVTRH